MSIHKHHDVAAQAARVDERQHDREAIARLLEGDEHVFRDLVRSHQGAMRALARRFCRSRDVADEIVQETWLAVLTGLHRFEGRSSLRTWIFRIVVNQSITRSKRERRSTPFSAIGARTAGSEAAVDPERWLPVESWSAPPPSWGSEPTRRLEGDEIRRLISAASRDLPPRQRLVFALRDIHLWSSEEVCELLQITPGNQRVILHRARARIRGALEDYVRGDAR